MTTDLHTAARAVVDAWYGEFVESETMDAAMSKLRDALASPPEQAEPGAPVVPSGWSIETGTGGFSEKGDRWACVRHLESQCGQDFYEDRDPLIFNFLNALAAAPYAPEKGEAA